LKKMKKYAYISNTTTDHGFESRWARQRSQQLAGG
jgi:hypothetical protein